MLIASQVVADKGITARLPPWQEGSLEINKLKARNILEVKVDQDNQLLVQGVPTSTDSLKEQAKCFIMNPEGKNDLAESPQKAVISLRNERGTSYKSYLKVYNEIKKAYEELWEAYCQKHFGRPYDDTLPANLRRQVRAAIPFMISEAE